MQDLNTNGVHINPPEELLDDDEIIKTDNGYTFVIGSASMMLLSEL